jgi:uncharacterized protein (DUF488 family)
MAYTVFTIGHSTYEQGYFVQLLQNHGITAICDIRSVPFSRKNPQFNRDVLEESLHEHGMVYRFLGRELGARSDNPDCYESGKVQYSRLVATESFRQGIKQVLRGLRENFRIALMCAEREPLNCHRSILVARHLVNLKLTVEHIHGDGSLESHDAAISRLVGMFNMLQEDMFLSRVELIARAYRRQEERIAYDANRTTNDKVATGEA